MDTAVLMQLLRNNVPDGETLVWHDVATGPTLLKPRKHVPPCTNRCKLWTLMWLTLVLAPAIWAIGGLPYRVSASSCWGTRWLD